MAKIQMGTPPKRFPDELALKYAVLDWAAARDVKCGVEGSLILVSLDLTLCQTRRTLMKADAKFEIPWDLERGNPQDLWSTLDHFLSTVRSYGYTCFPNGNKTSEALTDVARASNPDARLTREGPYTLRVSFEAHGRSVGGLLHWDPTTTEDELCERLHKLLNKLNECPVCHQLNDHKLDCPRGRK